MKFDDITEEQEQQARQITVRETKTLNFSSFSIEIPISYKEVLTELRQRGRNNDLRRF